VKKKAETQGYNPIASDREGKNETSVKREDTFEGTVGRETKNSSKDGRKDGRKD
jgi:hypothetical protein